jgi:putative membrane protein
MKRFFNTAAAAAVLALVALPAAAQSTDQAGSKPGGSTAGTTSQTGTSTDAPKAGSTAKAGSDKTFGTKAAEGGLAEVELGRLATQKASNDDVKKFGQMMVDDHTKANDQLKPLLQQKSMTAPETLEGKDKAVYDRLSKLSGDAFDRAYMRHMVEDHEKDVKLFKREAASGSDQELKQFASSTLPTLEKHLQDARQIHERMGGSAATSGTKKRPTTGTTGTEGTSHRPSTGDSSGSGANPPTPPRR